MSQGKQAKVLSEAQIKATTQYLSTTRNSLRDSVIFLLSVKSGLRAKEIASLTWQMVTDPEGNIDDAIALQNVASKGKNGGRTIPLNKELKVALEALKDLPLQSVPRRASPSILLPMSSTASVGNGCRRTRWPTGSSGFMEASVSMGVLRTPVGGRRSRGGRL